jgi:hypothetical protein
MFRNWAPSSTKEKSVLLIYFYETPCITISYGYGYGYGISYG